ncbi:polysaccharide biosynthesis tyrosine autokinase [Thermomonas sp. HDW16]|uniref:GumC family protein n=1 Tax=Thermomonas sp. HDW16 TaxID=2714945 RepID=UPI00140E0D62|nr:polysaccharide biosynthesis tyrosine autokinase [Thermomonas sp. HDW16]QIL20501.1 polysaccharide biosynthesis tyrosine autokinase [Thermomonas sp. HDW16]
MTDEHLPTGPADDRDRLPAQLQQDARRDLVAVHSQGGALNLDLLDERRDTDPDEIDLRAYWHILVKRRRLIASIAAATVAAAMLVTLMTQPQYRASALMQVEKEGPPIIATQGAMPYYDGWDPEFLNTQYELLRSRALAERVANELNLSGQTLDSLDDPGWVARVMALLRPAQKPKPASETPATSGKAEELLKRATGVIQGGLSVAPVKESRLVRLDFDSADPAFSVRAVNAVAEGFIASTLERRMGTTSYAKTYLEDQLAQTKSKLEESESKLVKFAQQEGLVNTGVEGTSLATQNLTELNALLAEAQSQRIHAQARWRQASGGGQLPTEILASSSVGTLRQQRAGLQSQYQQKLQTFKPDYPEMVQLKAQIDAANLELDAEMGRLRASVKAEYDAASSNEAMLKGQIANLRGQALDTDSRSIQYNILKREADTNRQLYDSLLQRFKEVGAAGDVRTNNISIIDRAQQGSRFKPNPSRNLAMGLLAGLLLGVLLAFVLEFLDDTLKTAEDVEQKLRLPVLGIIPKLEPKQTVAAAASNPQSAFSEAYRSVRTALQFATDHGVPRSLVITSPSPGEGKSTTALALARNLAQQGRRVLLVDGDLRNPSLHKSMGIKAELGLSNLLAGACSFSQAVLPSGEERLEIILSGPLPPNPAELLSGSKLISLLAVGAERYDHIIVDGPPVLGLADAPILANAVEGTLLVVTSGKTRISTAQQAAKRLMAARARLNGTLLTKYDAKSTGYGYHYDAYYAYGHNPRLGKG